MDEMFGISLAFDKRDKPCILIRLRYVKGNPVFQKVLYGDHEQILPEAKKIRDKALAEFKEKGWHPSKSRCQIRPNKKNISGVNGVRFGREKAKGGNGWYRYWQVSWSDKKSGGEVWPRAKSFYFTKYSDPLEAFLAAVGFRCKKEIELYGYTMISILKLDDYWQVAKKTIK